jgi:hypothetical protein
MNRKTTLVFFVSLTASVLISTQAKAGYDPTIGRWLNRDPIGEDGGTNLYRYVGNNPVYMIDPFGLWTAVVIGGGTAGNPFGHVGIGVSGSGIYSFGTTGIAPGSSFTGYLQAQAAYRSSDVYFINTTPEQESKILQFLQSLDPNLPKVPSADSHDTCATRVNDALGQAGFLDPSLGFMPFFNLGMTSPFPDSTAIMAALYSNGFVVHIPQGSSYSYGAPFTYINPK